MKQITVTITLEDEEAAWLENWRVFSPVPPHDPLDLSQKVAACVFRTWCAEDQREDES